MLLSLAILAGAGYVLLSLALAASRSYVLLAQDLLGRPVPVESKTSFPSGGPIRITGRPLPNPTHGIPQGPGHHPTVTG